LEADRLSTFLPNITKSGVEDKKLQTSCHDVEFENLMISQVSSKAIDKPGSKIWHCNQDFSGNSAEREACLTVSLQYQ
jgi:hypothetical protein